MVVVVVVVALIGGGVVVVVEVLVDVVGSSDRPLMAVLGGPVVVVATSAGSTVLKTCAWTENCGSVISITTLRSGYTLVTLPIRPAPSVTGIPTATPSRVPTVISTVFWKLLGASPTTWANTLL